jgi:predicted transcriptional regulator of viral defense system
MKNLIESCCYFIVCHGRGWAFSSSDLLSRFSRQQADSLLSELVKQGKIRRVARGMYDYPAYSELLKKELSPDMDQVANAYARKFNWRIAVSGETALYMLELSTQMPATTTRCGK